MKRGNIFRFISHEDTSRTRQAFARRTAISTLPVLVPTQRHWSRWFRWWPWRSRRWRLRFWFRRLSGPFYPDIRHGSTHLRLWLIANTGNHLSENDDCYRPNSAIAVSTRVSSGGLSEFAHQPGQSSLMHAAGARDMFVPWWLRGSSEGSAVGR